MGVVKFLGHHGSSAKNCINIRKNGFLSSSWGWLGSGIYFFEDDKQLAQNWARLKYKAQRIDVIECNLEVSEEKLLDISYPKGEGSNKVNKFKEVFLRQANDKGKIINLNDQNLDNKILNLICTKDGYEIVRNYTHTRTELDRLVQNYNSLITNGIELCVRNSKCITINNI